MLGWMYRWRDNILLHNGTYTLILECAIRRGSPRLINPITRNINSYLSWIRQVKNGLVSDHHLIGVPVHINHPLMNKGFHVNLTISFHYNIIDQTKLKIKLFSDMGNHTPYQNVSGSRSRNLVQIISRKGGGIKNSTIGHAMH